MAVLLIHRLLFVFGPCFVMQYLVSILVLQSSRRGRELVALLCLPAAMWP